MLPDTRRLDLVFKWIKTATILLVSLYMIGCYLLIRKNLSAEAGKIDYSVSASPKSSSLEILLKKSP